MSLPLAIYGYMMSDRRRNDALAEAVRAVVRPGDVVADVGAGVGYLSILAAKAGAARVYAIEATNMIKAARQLVERNGVAEVVRIEEKTNSLAWEPPERVDVVLSETLGYAVLDEGIRVALADARERMLREGGRLMPKAVRTWGVPVSLPRSTVDPDYIDGAGGLDLRPLGDVYRELYRREHVPARCELAAPRMLFELDCSTMASEGVLRAEAKFEARLAGRLTGFALWFEAELADGIFLISRSPERENHWGQSYLPSRDPREVQAGDPIDLWLEMNDRPRFSLRWGEAGTGASAALTGTSEEGA